MELRRFLYSMARMCWLIILLGIAGGTATAFLTGFSIKPIYSSDTMVYALNKGSSVNNQSTIDYQNILISRQLINDYQDIIKSEKVMGMAEGEIKDPGISQEELKEMISISAQDESSIIVITATANDPKEAAAVSRAVAKSFIKTLSEMTETNIVGVIDEAKTPAKPIANPGNKIIIIGILLGLGTAVLIIFAIDFFDTTIRFYEDVELNTNLQIVGVIPKYGIK